jgi:Spy/CpxP family protein refolding chaperone
MPQAHAASTGTPKGPHGMHGNMQGKMKEKLGLTDEQATQLKTHMDAHHAAVKPLRDQRRQSLEKLKTQVQSKASDTEIQATLDQLKTTQQSLQAEWAKMADGTATFLTPTQRAKMLLMQQARGKGGMHKGQKGAKNVPTEEPIEGGMHDNH